MSVSFTADDSPERPISYGACDCLRNNEDGALMHRPAHNSCFMCHGKGEVTGIEIAYDMNIANAHAADYVQVISGTREYCGHIDAKDVPKALRNLWGAVNRNPAQLVRVGTQQDMKAGLTSVATGVTHGGQCGFYDMGADHDRVARRLKALIRIFKWASDNNKGVGWG